MQYCTHHAPFYPRELLAAGVLQPRIFFSLFLARTRPSFHFSHPDDCFFVSFYAVDSSLQQDVSLCRFQLVFCFSPCASRLDVTMIPSYVSIVFFWLLSCVLYPMSGCFCSYVLNPMVARQGPGVLWLYAFPCVPFGRLRLFVEQSHNESQMNKRQCLG